MRPKNRPDRRETPRHPLARIAKIQTAANTKPCYCVVTDISDGGVQLNVFGADIPDEFALSFSGDGPADDGVYKVIWRDRIFLGAKRLSDVPRDA